MQTKLLSLILLLFVSLGQDSFAQNTNRMKSNLQKAVVYYQGAELTHIVKNAALIKGLNTISINDLSEEIDIETIKVKATKEVIIKSHKLAIRRKDGQPHSLVIQINSPEACISDLEIQYYTPLAYWGTYHNIIIPDIDSISDIKSNVVPVEIVTKAELRQQTGFDWIDTDVVLSTTVPECKRLLEKDINKKELLTYYKQNGFYVVDGVFMGYYSPIQYLTTDMIDSIVNLNGVEAQKKYNIRELESGITIVSLKENVVFPTFHLNNVTIEHNTWKKDMLDIQKHAVASEYKYTCDLPQYIRDEDDYENCKVSLQLVIPYSQLSSLMSGSIRAFYKNKNTYCRMSEFFVFRAYTQQLNTSLYSKGVNDWHCILNQESELFDVTIKPIEKGVTHYQVVVCNKDIKDQNLELAATLPAFNNPTYYSVLMEGCTQPSEEGLYGYKWLLDLKPDKEKTINYGFDIIQDNDLWKSFPKGLN